MQDISKSINEFKINPSWQKYLIIFDGLIERITVLKAELRITQDKLEQERKNLKKIIDQYNCLNRLFEEQNAEIEI